MSKARICQLEGSAAIMQEQDSVPNRLRSLREDILGLLEGVVLRSPPPPNPNPSSKMDMDDLLRAIHATPIIDHHGHNLLLPSHVQSPDYNFLTITSEASGLALEHATSTLAHLRAVKQLAKVLDCDPTWAQVQIHIDKRRREADNAWARRCFAGIETVCSFLCSKSCFWPT